jgi:hypothetical protein
MNYLYRITSRKVYCIRYSTSDLQSLIASYQRSSMISDLIVPIIFYTDKRICFSLLDSIFLKNLKHC